jgi:hypothetical protein
LTETRMFGALAFLINGNMAVSASSQGGLLLRVDPVQRDALVNEQHAQRFTMPAREMDGWLRIDADALETDDDLERWIDRFRRPLIADPGPDCARAPLTKSICVSMCERSTARRVFQEPFSNPQRCGGYPRFGRVRIEVRGMWGRKERTRRTAAGAPRRRRCTPSRCGSRNIGCGVSDGSDGCNPWLAAGSGRAGMMFSLSVSSRGPTGVAGRAGCVRRTRCVVGPAR